MIASGKKISLKEVEEIWIKNEDNSRKKIKKAYKSLKGGINNNSMTLFSGVREVGTQIQYNSSYKNVGCLYTGDYEAKEEDKWETLKQAYEGYWEWIGMIQVPHHGSSKNCNDNLISKNAVYFLSAGKKNKHGHPSKDVVHDITLKYGNNLYIVTEDKGIEVMLNNEIEIFNTFSSFSETIENDQGESLKNYLVSSYLMLKI